MSSSLTSCLGCRGAADVPPSPSPPPPPPPPCRAAGGALAPTAAPRGLKAQNGGSNQGNHSLSPIWGAVPVPSRPTPAGNTEPYCFINSFLLTPGAPDSCPELGNAKGLGWSGPRGGQTGVSKQRTQGEPLCSNGRPTPAFSGCPSSHPSVGNSTRCSGRTPHPQPSLAQTRPSASTEVAHQARQLSPDPDVWVEGGARAVDTGGPTAEKSQ